MVLRDAKAKVTVSVGPVLATVDCPWMPSQDLPPSTHRGLEQGRVWLMIQTIPWSQPPLPGLVVRSVGVHVGCFPYSLVLSCIFDFRRCGNGGRTKLRALMSAELGDHRVDFLKLPGVSYSVVRPLRPLGVGERTNWVHPVPLSFCGLRDTNNLL